MVRVERRQPVLSRQLDNYIARNRRLYGARHNQAAIRTLREYRDGALDLAGVTHADRADLHPERWRRGLDRAELGRPGCIGWILKERRSFYARCDLLEQPQPFRGNAVFIQHKTSSVAARPSEAIDQTGADWFGDLHEHDRHSARRLEQRPSGRSASSQDDVGRECNQFRRVSANALGVARAPADVDANVATVGPAQLRQRLRERQDAPLRYRIVHRETHEHTDPPHPLRLLRARRERPRGRRAAQQGDERASFHSITSSARPDSGSGTVMPSALAVLRLMISSTLVTCWTGRSAGFSPLRMRPV